MTREEASTIAVGDKVIYKDYYAFKVKDIQYTTPKDMKHTSILFVDNTGGSYNHRYCRRFKSRIV